MAERDVSSPHPSSVRLDAGSWAGAVKVAAEAVPPHRTNLYEQVGGHEALAAAVAVFYQRVVADPTLRPWFDGVDLGRLKSHQRAFLAAALGGPDLFAGRDLGAAHAALRITDEAFDAVVDHLTCTLRDLGVDTDVVARVGEHVDALRARVVGRDLP